MTCQFLLFILVNQMTTTLQQQSNNITTFYNRFYNSLAQKRVNLVVSPLNIHIILSLLYQGSTGRTVDIFRENLGGYNKITNAVHYRHLTTELNSAENVTLYLANKLYAKQLYRLSTSYKSIVKYYFSAAIASINLRSSRRAAETMNAWIREKTDNGIDQVVSYEDLGGDICAVALSGIYFKAAWVNPFYRSKTYVGKFHLTSRNTVRCEMMHQINYFEYADSNELDAQFLKMDYMNRRFSMIIVLPKTGPGVRQLEKRLLEVDVSSLINSGVLKRRIVVLDVPKFKINSTLSLQKALSKMGFKEAFSYFATYGHIIDTNETITIDRLVQKTLIEVSEGGTKVESNGGWQRRKIHRSARSRPVTFKANHPFVFYLMFHSDTNKTSSTVILMGRVNQPTIVENDVKN